MEKILKELIKEMKKGINPKEPQKYSINVFEKYLDILKKINNDPEFYTELKKFLDKQNKTILYEEILFVNLLEKIFLSVHSVSAEEARRLIITTNILDKIEKLYPKNIIKDMKNFDENKEKMIEILVDDINKYFEKIINNTDFTKINTGNKIFNLNKEHYYKMHKYINFISKNLNIPKEKVIKNILDKYIKETEKIIEYSFVGKGLINSIQNKKLKEQVSKHFKEIEKENNKKKLYKFNKNLDTIINEIEKLNGKEIKEEDFNNILNLFNKTLSKFYKDIYDYMWHNDIYRTKISKILNFIENNNGLNMQIGNNKILFKNKIHINIEKLLKLFEEYKEKEPKEYKMNTFYLLYPSDPDDYHNFKDSFYKEETSDSKKILNNYFSNGSFIITNDKENLLVTFDTKNKENIQNFINELQKFKNENITKDILEKIFKNLNIENYQIDFIKLKQDKNNTILYEYDINKININKEENHSNNITLDLVDDLPF